MPSQKKQKPKSEKFSPQVNERLPQYVGLAYRLATKFPTDVLTIDERRQAALIGVAHALESFDPKRSSELSWAYLKGFRAIEDAIRYERRRKKRFQTASWSSIFSLEARSEGSEPGNGKLLPDEQNDAENASIKLLRAAMKRLDLRTRQIVRLLALKGLRQKDVAQRFGISQSWCSRLYRRGLQTIRAYIEERLPAGFTAAG